MESGRVSRPGSKNLEPDRTFPNASDSRGKEAKTGDEAEDAISAEVMVSGKQAKQGCFFDLVPLN